MKYTRFIRNEDVEYLQYDVISQELRIYLTRLLESVVKERSLRDNEVDLTIRLINLNQIINKSRRLVGLPAVILESDEEEYYYPTVHAWHLGEFELVFRRISTIQFIEFVCELIDDEFLSIANINRLFEREGSSFRIQINDDGYISVQVFPIEILESKFQEGEHPNIVVLVNRMDSALKYALDTGDAPPVISASATIFETMAKDIINSASIQTETLGGFFEKYRKNSRLPKEILDYILSIYNERSSTPLAAHGSTQTPPEISKEQLVALVEMTKAFVRIEYTLYDGINKQDFTKP